MGRPKRPSWKNRHSRAATLYLLEQSKHARNTNRDATVWRFCGHPGPNGTICNKVLIGPAREHKGPHKYAEPIVGETTEHKPAGARKYLGRDVIGNFWAQDDDGQEYGFATARDAKSWVLRGRVSPGPVSLIELEERG